VGLRMENEMARENLFMQKVKLKRDCGRMESIYLEQNEISEKYDKTII